MQLDSSENILKFTSGVQWMYVYMTLGCSQIVLFPETILEDSL